MKKRMKETVYADYAASAPISERALAAFCETARLCGNPSAIHEAGSRLAEVVERARASVAGLIGADPGEICFTSGGTESDNWAVTSGLRYGTEILGRPRILAVSSLEHDAVLRSAYAAAGEGNVRLLPVSEDGIVPVPPAEELPEAALYTVMTANNETGVIQPVKAWAEAAHRKGALFHTDAVQAAGQIPFDVRETSADLVSLSAHKMHGPVGVGALYIRRELADRFAPFHHGGGQEKNLRPGTVPAALIAAFGAAAEEAAERMAEDMKRTARIRDRIECELLRIPGAVRNGAGKRLPGIANLSFSGVGGEALAIQCGLDGVMVSAGSACHAGSEEPSRVILAMTGDRERAMTALRISIGRETGEEDAVRIVRAVEAGVRRIREA